MVGDVFEVNNRLYKVSTIGFEDVTADPEIRTKVESARTLGGYTQDELRHAFDHVANPLDWRAPLNRIVRLKDIGDGSPEFEAARIRHAVAFFTATDATILKCEGATGWVRVTATGYRDGPAGP